MSLEGKTVVVLVDDTYEDMEVWYPLLRMREAGAAVIAVGPEKDKEYKAKYGYPITSDAAAGDVKPGDVDAVVIPGGYAPDRIRRHPEMIQLVTDVDKAGGVVAFICHGGWVAASAGVVKGKTATSFFAIKDDMENAGCNWVDEEVVRDGNLISSRKPEDLPAFCRTIIEALTA